METRLDPRPKNSRPKFPTEIPARPENSPTEIPDRNSRTEKIPTGTPDAEQRLLPDIFLQNDRGRGCLLR